MYVLGYLYLDVVCNMGAKGETGMPENPLFDGAKSGSNIYK